MSQIVSDTIILDLKYPVDNLVIEDILSQKYGEVIRWAIIQVLESGLKISVTYISQN